MPLPKPSQILSAIQPLQATRNRILLGYLVILGLIFIVSIPVFRQLLFERIDRRVRSDMQEKVEIFQSLLAGELIDENTNDGNLDEIWLDNKDSRLKKPYNSQELEEFFDAFLQRQVPEDEVYLIAFIDGKLYKSSPRARPTVLGANAPLIQQWARATLPTQGQEKTNDSRIGDVLYTIEPVKVNQRTIGVFVLAHTTAGERAEALESAIVLVQVLGGVLIISSGLAWIVSGQILAPLRSLIATARKVGETDLTRRLPVSGGNGEMAELAIAFNEMMDRLQAAFESQRNFINDAGHELRTPVTIIRGHLELMGDDPIEREETVTLLLDELDRMSRMINDLILLAKSERPDFLQYESVDIQILTEELWSKVQGLAERNWHLAAVATGTVEIDRYRITQAIVNLAHNAVQHTRQGDKISIGSAIEAGYLHLWVQDTGEGIAAKDRRLIFERFARATHTRRRSEGSGLGLAIVRAIVEAHDGEIDLVSQLKFGSTFTLILPLSPHAPNSNRRR